MPVIPVPYRKFFFLGLLVQLIAAIFNSGYHHFDEHFQILEFANYKLGNSPVSDLPWEFTTHCRPALQPFIAYWIGKTLSTIGAYDPFTLTFILRSLSGVLSWWATCLITIRLIPEFHTEKVKRLFIASVFLLFFIPYLGVRFSAENFSATLLLFALNFILGLKDQNTLARKYLYATLAGLLLGFAFFTRLQMAFAIGGIGIWLLFIQRTNWKHLLLIFSGGLLGIGICVLIDHWFYNEWVFSPYEYFYVNMIQKVAETRFGADPWYWYFSAFAFRYIPVVGIFMLLLFCRGIWKRPRHVFTFVTLFFILAHTVVAHKEMRFLFPMAYPFLVICFLGLDSLFQKHPALSEKRSYVFAIRTLTIVNILLLCRWFLPVQFFIPALKYVYNSVSENTNTIISLEKDLYQLESLQLNFYKPQNITVITVQDTSGVGPVLKNTNEKKILLASEKPLSGLNINGYRLHRVYSPLPEFIYKFNYNNWISRTKMWTIYEISIEK